MEESRLIYRRTARQPIHHVRFSALLIVCVAVVGGALLFQYVGGLEPCELCLLERWPYYTGIPLLVVALIAGKHPVAAISILTVAAVLFLAGSSIAAYHVGVEHHWIAGPTACTMPMAQPNSIEALKAQLMAQQPVQCDVVQWSLFGVSLAGWNLIASLALVAIAVSGLRVEWRLRKMLAAKGGALDRERSHA